MAKSKKLCFVIMPFHHDYNYFFLYLKSTIEKLDPNFICERADGAVKNDALFQKVLDYINKAQLIVAICTKFNPNVFLELGIAQEKQKPIIYLIDNYTKSEIPSDIIDKEFIEYGDPNKFEEGLRKFFEGKNLNEEVNNLYNQARDLIKSFKEKLGIKISWKI